MNRLERIKARLKTREDKSYLEALYDCTSKGKAMPYYADKAAHEDLAWCVDLIEKWCGVALGLQQAGGPRMTYYGHYDASEGAKSCQCDWCKANRRFWDMYSGGEEATT